MLVLRISAIKRHPDLYAYISVTNGHWITESWWCHQMKHFPRYWPFVRGIHRSPVNSQHKGQWRGALMFSLAYAWINGWGNNREAGDLRCHRAHYDVIVMIIVHFPVSTELFITDAVQALVLELWSMGIILLILILINTLLEWCSGIR